jgi:phosphate-selective porin OprO/OprP
MKNVLSKAALAALAAAGGAALVSGAAHAQTSTPTIQAMNGAPEIRDGQQRFKMRGRFQYDVISNDWDNDVEEGTRSYVRRAFLGAQGRLTDRWRYKIDFVLNPGASGASGGSNEDEVAVDDAFLEYAGDFFSFVVGENNVVSPLEDRISSLDIPFIERSSVVNAFGYGRLGGLAFLTNGANWTAGVGVYGDSLNNQDSSFNADESTTVQTRLTWTPIYETSPEGVTLVHLGLVARERYNGDDGTFQYRTRPLNGRGARHIDAGSAGQGDTTIALELAAQYNQFGLTAEYHTLEGENVAGTSFEYDGYYVDATWSLTGEARSYRGNTGSFGAIAPRNPVNTGGLGHWMLSARYDYVDLSDPNGAGANRGEQTAYAVGLDWIPVDHVRFKLNYAMTDMDRSAGADTEAQVISLRSQFDF